MANTGDLVAGKVREEGYLQRLAELEAKVKSLEQTVVELHSNLPTYTVTGTSTDRALSSADALAAVINVLGTLINDLKTRGLLQ